MQSSHLLPPGRSFELSQELLKGAIDIHVHAGPHIFSSPRRVDPVEAALQAREAGMRAIVYMDVFEMSNGTSWIVNRVLRDQPGPFETFGGLIMNTVYGGMNPRAVKTALFYGTGAKYISFGAHSTYFQAAREGHIVDGKFVPLSELYPQFKTEELDRCIRIPVEGDVSPELDEILRLIAEHPHVYLNTGHISVPEALRLVELAEEYGIEKVLIASSVTKIATMDELKWMASKGAFIEYTLAAYTHTTPIPKTHYYVEREYMSIDEGMDVAPDGGVKKVSEQIRELGPEQCILATDFGVYTLPTPVEGFREFVACMLDLGIPADDIRTMIKTNPERLLGLEPLSEQDTVETALTA
ncbi:MAG: DUF6282 family protein [Bacteroidetes bacterium]|nr:DUF6282 family protein [Bacteroidota bacterium]MDA1332848.1 DUF6282 family protein [Bacteroidota bacterium]